VTDVTETMGGSEGAGRSRAKGLRPSAIGLVATIVIGVASTAPGYSLASSLTSTVGSVNVQAPLIMILAFVPMFFVAYAYKELRRDRRRPRTRRCTARRSAPGSPSR
jgi:hypothetical protein